MASSPSTRTKVFISYSHADKEWLERLRRHLKPLDREGRLECWDDTHIRPGDDWKQEIQNALDTAQVAVLLISADFFASDFILNPAVGRDGCHRPVANFNFCEFTLLRCQAGTRRGGGRKGWPLR